ncbi:GGDEF domain-containing protein [Salmonella enterica subsp. enterica serovar Saintpaul]|nr:GGDEF domain-containing protein [Salmonella enterica subsp. enterica serovar Saintpaul]
MAFLATFPVFGEDDVLTGILLLCDSRSHPANELYRMQLRHLVAQCCLSLNAIFSDGYRNLSTGLPNLHSLTRRLRHLQNSHDHRRQTLLMFSLTDAATLYELGRTVGVGATEGLVKAIADQVKRQLVLSVNDRLYFITVGCFALLSGPGSPLTPAQVASALRALKVPLAWGGRLPLHFCCGEEHFMPGRLMVDDILRRSISALYEANDTGQERVAFDVLRDRTRTTHLALMRDLEQVLYHRRELCTFWQPKVCLATGRTTGMEALLRWQHPVHGWVSPEEFLPLAEKLGLMTMLTRRVFTLVTEQLAEWQREGGPLLPVSVNVSATDLTSPGFADFVTSQASLAGLSPGVLGIECLETESLTTNVTIVTCLNTLRQRGVPVSLDDFGEGYSNIGALKHLPLDKVKLDRSLVRHIDSDAMAALTIRHTISLLKALGYRIVAEGVETAMVADMLKAAGCDAGQGYYFSCPLATGEAERWLIQSASRSGTQLSLDA